MISRSLWHGLQAIHNYNLPLKELKKIQDKKVRDMAHYAYRYVKFYRDRFRSVGLTPDDIRHAEDIRRLPVLTKQEVREKSHQIRASGKDITQVLRKTTSGSTGPPLEIFRDIKSFDVHFALGIRNHWIWRIMPWYKTARITYIGPLGGQSEGASARPVQGLPLLRRIILGPWFPRFKVPRQRTLGLRKNIKEVAPDLLDFRPDVLMSRPSYLRRLIDWGEKTGQELHIKKILFEGEYCSRAVRHEIEGKYQAEVYNLFGTIELGPLGSECHQHNGLHLNSDYFVFELSRDGEPVSPGERGEVFVTSLHNEFMPLIRYELGDIATAIEDERCNCGSCLQRLKEIEGRKSDGLLSQDGTLIPPTIIVNYIDSNIGIKQYQVIQRNKTNILVRLTTEEAIPRFIEPLMVYLKEVLGEHVTVKTEIEQDFIKIKYRPVYNQILKE
jgi:phenylacetate-CoA ligase